MSRHPCVTEAVSRLQEGPFCTCGAGDDTNRGRSRLVGRHCFLYWLWKSTQVCPSLHRVCSGRMPKWGCSLSTSQNCTGKDLAFWSEEIKCHNKSIHGSLGQNMWAITKPVCFECYTFPFAFTILYYVWVQLQSVTLSRKWYFTIR